MLPWSARNLNKFSEPKPFGDDVALKVSGFQRGGSDLKLVKCFQPSSDVVPGILEHAAVLTHTSGSLETCSPENDPCRSVCEPWRKLTFTYQCCLKKNQSINQSIKKTVYQVFCDKAANAAPGMVFSWPLAVFFVIMFWIFHVFYPRTWNMSVIIWQ